MQWNLIIIALIILGVCISIFVLVTKYKMAKYYKSDVYKNTINMINEFLVKLENVQNSYIAESLKNEIDHNYKKTREKITSIRFKESDIPQKELFVDYYDNLNTYKKEWNKKYVESELILNKEFFNDIDGKSLDNEQRLAVIVDEDNNLVIAGAGSGKTLTISAKVKYLVDKKGISSDEILLLSFTKKAANEMQDRITDRMEINVEAKTFHKLGLEIISTSKGHRPEINSESDKIITDYFIEEVLTNKTIVSDLMQFFSYYLSIPISLDEIDNLGEAYDYYKNVDLETIRSKIEKLKSEKTTMQGEKVKSYEEVVIANYLYLKGINYEYEKIYPFEQPDKFRKKYSPDFYLIDYDLYLEHFGISKDNKVPWLSKIEEEKYLDGIKWKREQHKLNKTQLIETYSYNFSDGHFLNLFEKKLKACGVLFSPVDYNEVYRKLFIDNNNENFKEFVKLATTFINLFKSRGFSDNEFDKMAREAEQIENNFFKDRTKLFLSIAKPLYKHYQKELSKKDQIDFNDMINNASEYVAEGLLKLRYKYIIIDEFQDMSHSRYKLLKAIRDQSGAKIMCVGDDWQSIYRFTGSDIDLFVNFSKYFGYTELLKIQKTYRNSQELINIASKFVTENPKQIKKDLKSDKSYHKPVRIFGYDTDFEQAFERAIESIVQSSNNEDIEILLIGRTNYDISVFDSSKNADSAPNESQAKFEIIKERNSIRLKHIDYPKLYITFLTAHSSKGVEAEHVIILNMKNQLMGFPNKISDDPILKLLLTNEDTFSYEEERRLFYVAITRTKNSVYLITPQKIMSVFADELIKKQEIAFEFYTDEENIITNPNCPRCEKGHLILRENNINGSKFLGCSNFPQCDNTFKLIVRLTKFTK